MEDALPAPAPRRLPLLLILGIGAVVIVLIAAGATAGLLQRPAKPAPAVDPVVRTEGQGSATLAARNAVLDRFPMAVANFGEVAVYWRGDDPTVCGKVDLDEPEDTFDGPERFTYIDGQLLIEQVDGAQVVTQKWLDACR